MEVFRVSSTKYSKELTASGKAARWNKDGEFVIYTGETRSLAMLENIVHKSIQTGLDYETMILSITDSEGIFSRKRISDLPSNWRDISAYSKLQDIGSKWYHSKESLVLQVPSVIVPQEFNYIINANHPEFKNHITLVRQEEFVLDNRLH
ncbi:RES family NAD+ phosphorylase [uncultured Fluviicola sp.]|uniref:RES family NAD+ phosphorylase n=1 Tax=uncultured Fluviicola sp. TaxID=463303 RepID=UPI0025E0F0A7|nr:RES family NAD+ phosphorylase [uncultured Fluviicola sp.]